MQIHFTSRTKARAFGKAVDNGANAERRWGVNIEAKAKQRAKSVCTATNSNGSPVMVTTYKSKGV